MKAAGFILPQDKLSGVLSPDNFHPTTVVGGTFTRQLSALSGKGDEVQALELAIIHRPQRRHHLSAVIRAVIHHMHHHIGHRLRELVTGCGGVGDRPLQGLGMLCGKGDPRLGGRDEHLAEVVKTFAVGEAHEVGRTLPARPLQPDVLGADDVTEYAVHTTERRKRDIGDQVRVHGADVLRQTAVGPEVVLKVSIQHGFSRQLSPDNFHPTTVVGGTLTRQLLEVRSCGGARRGVP